MGKLDISAIATIAAWRTKTADTKDEDRVVGSDTLTVALLPPTDTESSTGGGSTTYYLRFPYFHG
jgi:hypothetical protein